MDRYLSVGVLCNLNVVGGPELQEIENKKEVFIQIISFKSTVVFMCW